MEIFRYNPVGIGYFGRVLRVISRLMYVLVCCVRELWLSCVVFDLAGACGYGMQE
jgi:hypothetical protein